MKTKLDYKIYLVTDEHCLQGKDFFSCVEQALQGGITLLQYRDKTANSKTLYNNALKLKVLCQKYSVPLLINDRLDIAQAVDADGVHLGQSDLAIDVARRILGKNKIVGATAHNLGEVKTAIELSADYVGCGAVFGTNTKKDATFLGLKHFKELVQKSAIPIV